MSHKNIHTHYINNMDERLKRINELTKKVAPRDDKTQKIINFLFNKYPELKNYTYKTQKMSIQIGSSLKYISHDLKTISEGVVSSVKYYDHKEEEPKIILSIVVTKENEHWKKIYTNNYYLFTSYNHESSTTKLIKKVLKETYDNDLFENVDELFENADEFDGEQYLIDQANEYYKNYEITKSNHK